MGVVDLPKGNLSSGLMHIHPTTQMLLTTKPPIHMPDAGLNPLVDAAAYLFSLMGKLSQTKQYKNVDILQVELLHEINNFRDTIQNDIYKPDYVDEYILISCYTLCATLDNIISNTVWGNQGKWDQYSLVNANNHISLSHEHILIILERLVCAPDIYIDVMEFMYICLSFGLTFKRGNQTPEFSQEQLRQITYSLYKRIRAYRGSYNKILSPFSIKPPTLPHKQVNSKAPRWLRMMLVISFFAALFAVGKYWIDSLNQDQAPQHFSRMETHGHEKNNELH